MDAVKGAQLTDQGPLVGLVGPCGSGKSAVVGRLRQLGVQAREIAQEHSYVPSMWRRITGPDLLIYLQVSCQEAGRRKGYEMPGAYWDRLESRLAHARAHADLIIDTDGSDLEAVVAQVVAFLKQLEEKEGLEGQ
jgi:hypothetical protein